jgi:hypothetical protein
LEALAKLREPPLITAFCALEVCYFLSLKATPAAEAAFVRSLVDGTFRLVEFTTTDLNRTAELIEQYTDLPLGAADGDREKPWDGSGGDVERLTWAGESGVPAGEVAGEVVVEDAGADLQEQVGAAG